MVDLLIEKTSSTPNIRFEANTGLLKIEGRSITEDPVTFYTPVLAWLDYYVKNAKKLTVLSIKLEYINSGSCKAIMTLLKMVRRLHSHGKIYKINWYYENDDESIRDLGRYFSSILKSNVELIEV